MTAPTRLLPRSLGVAVPLAAFALAVAGCSTQQYPTDAVGTTPPVWTGSTSPGAEHGEEADEGHGSSSESESESGEANHQIGQVVEMVNIDGEAIGSVGSVRQEDNLVINILVQAGSGLAPGDYDLTLHTMSRCEPVSDAGNDAQFPFQSAGDELTIDGAPVPLEPLVIAEDGSGTLNFTSELPPATGSLIVSPSGGGAQDREACAALF